MVNVLGNLNGPCTLHSGKWTVEKRVEWHIASAYITALSICSILLPVLPKHPLMLTTVVKVAELDGPDESFDEVVDGDAAEVLDAVKEVVRSAAGMDVLEDVLEDEVGSSAEGAKAIALTVDALADAVDDE